MRSVSSKKSKNTKVLAGQKKINHTTPVTVSPLPTPNMPVFNTSIIDVRMTNQESGDLSDKSVFVERASSSNSVCALCQQTIREGSLRMGLRIDSSLGDFAVVRWNHLCCFPFVANRYPSLVVCKEDIRGITTVSSRSDLDCVLKAALLDSALPSKEVIDAAGRLDQANTFMSTLSTSQLTSIAKFAGYNF